EFNNLLTNIDQKHHIHEVSEENEKELLRRMKKEAEDALVRQWQAANERLAK
ncbi:unnamed protein product, partial [Didymodactylos carnosus]